MSTSKTVTTTIVTRETRSSICYEDLCTLLQLPIGARIWVEVPGGGDWSNTSLEIGPECPLHTAVVVTDQTREDT